MNKRIFYAKVSDNQDPDNLHRVKITYNDENESVSEWVPVVSYSAGSDSGFFCLPDVDEQVLVACINNDANSLCVIGSLWSEQVQPPETGENSDADLNKDGKNSLHFVKSRSGSQIILDDTESKEKIQMISAEGKSRLEFSAEDELINMETENDIQISAKEKLLFDAEEIEMTSSKQTNISAEEFQTKVSKGLDISADKDITVKGSGIALN